MSRFILVARRCLLVSLAFTIGAGRLHAQMVIALESDHVLDLAYSPDGSLIAGGGLDGKTRVWNAKTGDMFKSFEAKAGPAKIIRAVAFSSDSKWLAAGGDEGIVRVWEIDTGKLVLAWIGHEAMIASIRFSPDGKYLAAGSGTVENQGFRGAVKLYDLAAGRAGRSLQVAAEHMAKLAFAPDSKTLAVASGPVELWDVATGQLRKKLTVPDRSVLCVAFSADGKTLAGGGGHWIAVGGGTQQISEAWIWEADTGKLRHTLTDLNTWLRSIALSADGTRLATGCTGKEKTKGALSWVASELKLWDTATGKELWVLHGGPGDVAAIAYAPDGATIVSADHDTVRLSSAKTGAVTKTLMRTTIRAPGQ